MKRLHINPDIPITYIETRLAQHFLYKKGKDLFEIKHDFLKRALAAILPQALRNRKPIRSLPPLSRSYDRSLLECLTQARVLYYTNRESDLEFRPKQKTNGTRITYLGHTSILIETDNRTLLIDPMMLALTPAHWKMVNDRQGAVDSADLPFSLSQLPQIDAIAISHSHPDHMDPFTLFWFDKTVPVFIPKVRTPLASLIKPMGYTRLISLRNWEESGFGGIRLTRVPSRRQLDTRGYTEQCTWLVRTPDVNVYLGTDICLMPITFARLASETALDVAFLPASDHFHVGRQVTMDARQSLEAARILKPGLCVPYACWDHWWLPKPPESFRGTRRLFMKEAERAGVPAHCGPAGTSYLFEHHRLKRIGLSVPHIQESELRRVVALSTIESVAAPAVLR